jgi:hypothetical protein
MRRSLSSRPLRLHTFLGATLVVGFVACGGSRHSSGGGKAGSTSAGGKAGGGGSSGRGGGAGNAGEDAGGQAGEEASGGSGVGGSATAGKGSTSGGKGGSAGRGSGGRGGTAGTAPTGGVSGSSGDSGEGGGDAGGEPGVGGASAGNAGTAGSSAGGSGGGGPTGSCVKVTPDGDDVAAAASSGATPFETVQAAIDFAAANPSIATEVCVAAGASCGMSAAYPGPSSAPLRMRDGIDVYGRYESTGFTRCVNSTTTLLPTTTAGVLFDSDVANDTVLDGFTIALVAGSEPAGVTVDGASNVLLNDVLITDAPSAIADSPYGVRVVSGGDAVITNSEIRLMLERNVENGLGVGIHSLGSRVRVSDSSVFGHVQFGQVAGIYLADSPSSEVLDTTITVTKGSEGDYSAFGVWADGDVDQVLLDGLSIDIKAGDSSTGVGFSGAGEAILRDSTVLVASGGLTTDGVFADADDALIDGNHVVADFASANLVDEGTVVAIYCETTCTIRRNIVHVEHTATTIGSAGTSVGIDCSGCDEISENVVRLLEAIGGIQTSYYEAFGIDAGAGDVLIDRNVVTLGCADSAIGVWATGARIQNNSITGRACAAPEDLPVFSNGLVAGGGSVVHSNTIFSGSCTGDDAAVFLNSGGATLRNNILGGCGFNVEEPNGDRDPLFITNNDFMGPSYRNGTTTLSSLTDINALPGAAANFSADCSGVPPTPCTDTGTPTDAPAYDIEGDPRSNPPDVGADER